MMLDFSSHRFDSNIRNDNDCGNQSYFINSLRIWLDSTYLGTTYLNFESGLLIYFNCRH